MGTWAFGETSGERSSLLGFMSSNVALLRILLFTFFFFCRVPYTIDRVDY